MKSRVVQPAQEVLPTLLFVIAFFSEDSMQWFKHDTGATQDAKIRKLILRYGVTGYGIYFHCLELIAGSISESNITFELEHDSEIIADDLKITGDANKSGVQIVEEVMKYIVSLGLFEESNGHIFCFKLLKRLDVSMTSNAKFRKLITYAKKEKDKIEIGDDVEESENSHDTVMIESCYSHDTIMQDKNRIDKNRIDKNNTPQAQALLASQDSENGEADILPKKKKELDPEAQRLATLLYTIHKTEIDQEYTVSPKQLDAWARDIEHIHKLDGRPYDEIEDVINWCKHDSFWNSNIMSGKKLREKFPTLLARMRTPQKQKAQHYDDLPVFERQEFDIRKAEELYGS
jgi:hypothetical protein